MHEFPRAKHITATVLILALISSIAVRKGSTEEQPRNPSWAAVGIGLAPSPYGLDENGSPFGDLALGKGVRERISIVAAVAHFEFFGTTAARFTPLSIGVRAHLSKVHGTEGGPYLGMSSVVCHARYRDREVPETRILPGLELAVGTMIPLSAAIAIDWAASHLLTPDAGGFSPHPLTRSTKRDGLDRGAVRVRLVLRR